MRRYISKAGSGVTHQPGTVEAVAAGSGMVCRDGRVLHVHPQLGNDANDGSKERPLRTCQAATDRLGAPHA